MGRLAELEETFRRRPPPLPGTPSALARSREAEELAEALNMARRVALVSRRRRVRRYFALGLAAGGAIGALVLLVFMQTSALRSAGALWTTPEGPFAFSISHDEEAFPTNAVSPSVGRGRWPILSFDLPIRKDERARAPLPLHVAGASKASRSAAVILRDVPQSTHLSRGERQDESTWVLRLSDLEDLHWTLSEGTPETFQITVQLAAEGAEISRALVRVRLVDAPATAAVPQPATKPAQDEQVEAEKPLQAGTSVNQVLDRKASTKPPPAAKTERTLTAPRAPQRPEGASALGGPVNEPARPARAERQLWWKIPVPAWVPFAERDRLF
jgi:hypothetical protein